MKKFLKFLWFPFSFLFGVLALPFYIYSYRQYRRVVKDEYEWLSLLSYDEYIPSFALKDKMQDRKGQRISWQDMYGDLDFLLKEGLIRCGNIKLEFPVSGVRLESVISMFIRVRGSGGSRREKNEEKGTLAIA